MTRRFPQRGSEVSHASSACANDSTTALASTGTPGAVSLAALVATLATFPAFAQSSDIVILRSVEPRVAYRGIPPEEMPVSVAVQPFPTERFGHNVDAVVTSLTDGDLAGAVSRHHTTGAQGHAAMSARTPPASLPARHEPLTAGDLPGPPGAGTGRVAGQVTQATGAMTGALMRALAPLSAGAGARP
jgi:hypothetical protein